MEKIEYKPKNIAGILAKYFLKSPLTSILGVFLLVVGYIALEITPREENPQIKVSGGTVMVMMPGASAEEVKNIIVEPLERKIKEIKSVENIHGVAMDDVGVVNVSFFIGENKQESDLKLYDKIMQNIDIFPKGIMQPIIKPLDIDTDIPILSIAFYSKEGMSRVELTKEVSKIQHRLNALENVAVTELIGEKKEQFSVLVDVNRLSGYNLSLSMIAKAIESISVEVPDLTTETKEGKLVTFGIKNAIESTKDIENIIVANYMGSPIYLRDIAKVSRGEDFQNKKNAYIYNLEDDKKEHQQVTLTISKLQGSNAVVIAEDVLSSLEEIKEQLKEKGIYSVVTRNDGDRANEAVNELIFHLVISIIIIAILLALVLGVRESIIVTFTVPAIFAITLFVAYLGDQSINRITLFALLMSLGLLVDDSIVAIENIHRHLHSKDSKEKEFDEVLIEATDEIGPPTNVATIAIILTMIPMYFVGKMMGEYMRPIPLNVPVALFASLFVAYIFTPYLARKFMKKTTPKVGAR